MVVPGIVGDGAATAMRVVDDVLVVVGCVVVVAEVKGEDVIVLVRVVVPGVVVCVMLVVVLTVVDVVACDEVLEVDFVCDDVGEVDVVCDVEREVVDVVCDVDLDVVEDL